MRYRLTIIFGIILLMLLFPPKVYAYDREVNFDFPFFIVHFNCSAV